jgi:hypothetical protein
MLALRNWIASHRQVLLISFFIITDIAFIVIFGAARSIDIPTFHLDGAYQTASGLYRLADGQWPGKDFYPYIGLGPLYILYPIFKIMGGNVAASLFAAYGLSAAMAAFSVMLITFFLAPSHRLLTGIISGSLVLCVVTALYPHVEHNMLERFVPGNSLRPLRSCLPYICMAGVFGLFYAKLRPTLLYGFLGLIAALASLWSNDYGIPTTIAVMIVSVVWAYHSGELTLKNGAIFLSLLILATFLGFVVATHSHYQELLAYNFMDVRKDQYWYFGPWSGDSRILSGRDFLPKIFHDMHRLEWVFLAIIVWVYKKPSPYNLCLAGVGLALLGGGILSTIGGHRGYFSPFMFWGKATVIICIILFLIKKCEGYFKPSWIKINAIIILLIIFIGTFSLSVQHLIRDKNLAKKDEKRFFVIELGGYLPIEWNDYVTQAQAAKGEPIIEEYWGLWSSIVNSHGHVPVDAIIHALGNTRTTFIDYMQTLPDKVVTSTRSMSPDWQPWNVSANWWFYKPLFEHYHATKTSPTTMLWNKTNIQTPWPAVPCVINQDSALPTVILTVPKSGYYEVTIEYNNKGLSPRTLVMARNNLNFAAESDGYISLDPNTASSQFPVALLKSGRNNLDLYLVTAKDNFTKISLTACTAKKILFSDPEILPVLQ